MRHAFIATSAGLLLIFAAAGCGGDREGKSVPTTPGAASPKSQPTIASAIPPTSAGPARGNAGR